MDNDNMTTNPFTYGNPISRPIRFFGRERESKLIFSRLRNAEFESSSIVGERRIGKTSLLNYISDQDVCKAKGFDLDRYHFVYMDLQQLDKNTTPVRMWQRLLQQIARSCQDAKIKRIIETVREADAIETFDLADVFDCVDENNKYIVLLLDEFDHIFHNPNFSPGFFYSLRSLAIQHNLSLITSSRRELIDLCGSEAVRSSPFFNIFANINIQLFTEAEAKRLISEPLAETTIRFTDAEIEKLLVIAGLHPYFLQAACFFLFDAYTRGLNPSERSSFLTDALHEQAMPHLKVYWDNSDEQEKIVLTTLALLVRQGKDGEHTFNMKRLLALYTHSDQTLARLEKRGLVLSKSDMNSLFSPLFGEWICNEITDTTRDQQGYEDWFRSNKRIVERLPTRIRIEIGDILPRISSQYRELIITWVSDPRNLIAVSELLKATIEVH